MSKEESELKLKPLADIGLRKSDIRKIIKEHLMNESEEKYFDEINKLKKSNLNKEIIILNLKKYLEENDETKSLQKELFKIPVVLILIAIILFLKLEGILSLSFIVSSLPLLEPISGLIAEVISEDDFIINKFAQLIIDELDNKKESK